MATGYRVLVDRRAEKDLKDAPRHVVARFVTALDGLAEDPLRPRPGFDVKPLEGLRGTYRLRLGTWRVLYQVDKAERVVRVTSAAPRGSAYR